MDEKAIEILEDTLKTSIVTVKFTKKNGEERVMKCTKCIPKMQEVNPEFTLSVSDKPKKKNENVLAVYDTEKLGWRSFRKDSIISFEYGGLKIEDK
jgi:hypothetical protein